MIKRDSNGVYDPTRINEIPLHWLTSAESILDIGAYDGKTQSISEYASMFKRLDATGEYLGVDVLRPDVRYLNNIVQADVLDFKTDRTFACVLCIHLLEHIERQHWPFIIRRLKSFVNPGGIIIIGTPYNELPYTVSDPSPMTHKVFSITERDLLRFFPTAEIRIIITQNRFNGDGAGLLKSHLRWFKRFIFRHPYTKSSGRILLRWKKEDEEGE